MKKLAMFLALALICVPAFATEFVNDKAPVLSVTAQETVHFYNDLNTSAGTGVKVEVKDVLLDNLVLRSGIEFNGVQLDYSAVRSDVTKLPLGIKGTTTTAFAGSEDLDSIVWSNEAGYDVNGSVFGATEKLDITPYIGVDSYFLNAGGASQVDNTVGMSLGVDASYKVKENIKLFAGLKYSWATADVTINAANGSIAGQEGEVELDNFGLVGGASFSF